MIENPIIEKLLFANLAAIASYRISIVGFEEYLFCGEGNGFPD
jgi:hypothetical protein